MRDDDLRILANLKREGYARAANTAPVLRAHGFDVITARIRIDHRRTKVVPYAPAWAISLVKKMRGLGLKSEVRKDVLAEALLLGRPGPLMEAAVVAGRMMR